MRVIEDLSARQPPRRAVVAAEAYTALGDKDQAFKWLFAIQRGDGFNYAQVDPSLDTLHSDPRWKELLQRMNLPAVGHADAALSR